MSRKKIQKLNKQKGKLLEDIIASLYDSPGVIVEKNVNYPTTDGEDTREIDILLKATVAGMTVEYAFQCKNEAKPIGVNKVGEFIAALQDIGIPTKYGVFVSVNGFTRGAIRSAKKNGIRTLVLKGLNKNRIKSEISKAIQHNVFLIPSIEAVTVTNRVSKGEYDWQFFIFFDEDEKPIGSILDLIFNQWRNNRIPGNLGKKLINLEVPVNWFSYYKGEKIEPMKITAKVNVLAVVIKIEGESKTHSLLDVQTNRTEKFNISANFNGLEEGENIPLYHFHAEDQLNLFLNESKNNRISTRVRLPRLISNISYYPFSKKVAVKMFDLLQKHSPDAANLSQEDFDQQISELSKNDIFNIGVVNALGHEVSVIVPDNDGDLIDVTILAEQGKYEEIISLKNRYREYPSEFFRKIIAWAFEEKSSKLFEKAYKVKPEKYTSLLEESLKNIRASLEFEPESLIAAEKLARLLYRLKDYPQALKVVELIIAKEEAKNDIYLLKVQTLTRLQNWKDALKELNNLEKKLKKSKGKYSESLFHFYRAEILTGMEQKKLAWQKLLNAWKNSPKEIIRYSCNTEFVEKLINEIPTIEGRLLYIETLFFKSVVNLKNHNFELAKEIADFAIVNLNDIKPLSQMGDEIVAKGEISGLMIEEFLIRISKDLKSVIEFQKFFEKNILELKNWFQKMYGEEANFI